MAEREEGLEGEGETSGSEHQSSQLPPTVIASHVDLTYRVFGAGREPQPNDNDEPVAFLQRLTQRKPKSVGIRQVEAVKDVSFVARQGESIGLIGRNGSGKSTLLRAVAGLIPPTQGEIYLNGRAALLGVNAVLMRQLSGARNVMIGGQALGLTKTEVNERFDDIVDFAGIGDFIDLPMSSYSSGMAARLRFAISTAAVPDILVVDEALATGDAEFRDRANERIQEIRESAGTIFLVSHSASNIVNSCGRALWMERGRLIMDGPSEDVVTAYEDTFGRTRKKRANRRETSDKAKTTNGPKANARRAGRKRPVGLIDPDKRTKNRKLASSEGPQPEADSDT